jgi:uncharacterized protein YdeI (YjbR/CyaY-like superfamily)
MPPPARAKQAKPDLPLLECPTRAAWSAWLAENHESSDGIWLKLAKKVAATPTVTYAEALEEALCYGWIDSQKGALNDEYSRQRFTRRGPRSKWSQINRDRAEQLVAAGRMQPAGRHQIEAAKADGRWAAAYEPQSRAMVPEDLQQALDQNPRAKEFFATLTGANRYAILFRIHDAKRPETRARRIATFIEMLHHHKTVH